MKTLCKHAMNILQYLWCSCIKACFTNIWRVVCL